jgi:TRAP-type C4-dicarboxylate transport system substrate-binding protein
MKAFRIAAGVCLLACFGLTAGTTQAADLRLLNAFVAKYPATQVYLEPFINNVKAATGGKTNITISGPEVISAFEQYEPTSKGAFDILFTVSTYHLGTNSVPFGLFALDPDPVAFRKNGVFEAVDKSYQKNNLKLLAIYPANVPGSGGYHAMLSKPIEAGKGIAGRKVRGNQTYQAMIEDLGAVSVTQQVGEVYSSIQRGVIDGAFGPVVGSLDYKWAEVAPYMTRPLFGNVYHLMVMNLTKYNSLSPAERKAIDEAAEKVEVPGMKAMEAKAGEEIAAMMKLGAKETSFDKASMDKALKAFNAAFWKTAIASKATGEDAKAFYELAKAKKLTE